jgi:hypothetical protein
MSTPSAPSSMAKGNRHDVYIISTHHGQKRLPIVQNFNVSDKLTSELISELGTKYPVFVTQTYEGSEVSFDVYDSDLNELYAMLMDMDPSLTAMGVKPEDFYSCPFNLYGNQLHEVTGKPIQGTVCQRVLLSDHSSSQDQKGNKKVVFKGTVTRAQYVRGCGIDYTRGVASAPPFATADDHTFDGSNYIALHYSVAALPEPGIGGTTYNSLLALKNSTPVSSGFTVSGAGVTLGTTAATTDVWEFLTPYIPA